MDMALPGRHGFGRLRFRAAQQRVQAFAGDENVRLVVIFPDAGTGGVQGEPKMGFELQAVVFLLRFFQR